MLEVRLQRALYTVSLTYFHLNHLYVTHSFITREYPITQKKKMVKPATLDALTVNYIVIENLI